MHSYQPPTLPPPTPSEPFTAPGPSDTPSFKRTMFLVGLLMISVGFFSGGCPTSCIEQEKPTPPPKKPQPDWFQDDA